MIGRLHLADVKARIINIFLFLHFADPPRLRLPLSSDE
jgi:hypothetical protein